MINSESSCVDEIEKAADCVWNLMDTINKQKKSNMHIPAHCAAKRYPTKQKNILLAMDLQMQFHGASIQI